MYQWVWFRIKNFFPVLTELAGESSGVTASPVSQVECLEAVGDEGEREVKRERRRKNIIEELFETEKTYLNHLEVTQKVSFG